MTVPGESAFLRNEEAAAFSGEGVSCHFLKIASAGAAFSFWTNQKRRYRHSDNYH